jgi:3D (Asp-Asp-Asp) domain-containing protein
MRGKKPIIPILSLMLSLGLTSSALAQVSTDPNELPTESDIPETIIPDDEKGIDTNVDDDSQFDPDLADQKQTSVALSKKPVDQLSTKACQDIIAVKDNFPKEQITKATQYFIPLFAPGDSGSLQRQDRTACIKIEGSCVVNNWLYNWLDKYNPWGKRYLRAEVPFKFGKGNGKTVYNTTNALDPCRTVAADPNYYTQGTVIYIPSMAGGICPQSGKPIDGCFVVGDVGGAIRGKGRFDLFTGECANYNKSNNTCADPLNNQFQVIKGAEFYVIGRNYVLAKTLREEADKHILNDWRLPAP